MVKDEFIWKQQNNIRKIVCSGVRILVYFIPIFITFRLQPGNMLSRASGIKSKLIIIESVSVWM